MTTAGALAWMKGHGGFKRGRLWFLTPSRLEEEDRRASAPVVWRLETNERSELRNGRLAASV
jgi:hypothetical protein